MTPLSKENKIERENTRELLPLHACTNLFLEGFGIRTPDNVEIDLEGE